LQLDAQATVDQDAFISRRVAAGSNSDAAAGAVSFQDTQRHAIDEGCMLQAQHGNCRVHGRGIELDQAVNRARAHGGKAGEDFASDASCRSNLADAVFSNVNHCGAFFQRLQASAGQRHHRVRVVLEAGLVAINHVALRTEERVWFARKIPEGGFPRNGGY
jgi:hypothetical protein